VETAPVLVKAPGVTVNGGPPRVALVLPGGGARGAYEMGALSVLLPALAERGERVSLICGTSVGAINAALLGSLAHLPPAEQAEVALGHWRELRRSDVISPVLSPRFGLNVARLAGDALRIPGIHRGGLLDPSPLRRYLDRHLSWPDLHRNVSQGLVDTVCVVATQLATGQPVAFVESSEELGLPAEPNLSYVPVKLTGEHVRASAAIPLVFPAVQIQAPRAAAGFYTDGATRLNSPISPAVELGADRVIVIGLEPLGHRRSQAPGPPPHLVDVMANVLDGMMVDQVVDDVQRLVAINSFFTEHHSVGTVPAARAYRAARGRRPYRRIAYSSRRAARTSSGSSPSASSTAATASCAASSTPTCSCSGACCAAAPTRAATCSRSCSSIPSTSTPCSTSAAATPAAGCAAIRTSGAATGHTTSTSTRPARPTSSKPPRSRSGAGCAAADRRRPSRGPTLLNSPGRVAQWESARFTRERSLVRNQPRPSQQTRYSPYPGLPVRTSDVGCQPGSRAFETSRADHTWSRLWVRGLRALRQPER
jgi:NTE family protein